MQYGWDRSSEVGVGVGQVIVDVNSDNNLAVLRDIVLKGGMEVTDGIVLVSSSVLVEGLSTRGDLKLLRTD
jgi:hypothetical protein